VRYGGFFEEKISRISSLKEEVTDSLFWEKPDSQKKVAELSTLEKGCAPYFSLETEKNEIKELFSLADDEEILKELDQKAESLLNKANELSITYALSGKHDESNAIVTIHPGAGGTESCDWAQMLLRMYLRWAERKGYKTQMLELQPGDGSGVKSATFLILGKYVYGWLKREKGIHRLVRISPFDANKRRHTSFASVFVMPEITDPIEVEIDEADLRIETFRSSSAGGQHVNKTDSAVRITHIPTGIVASCQNERSQYQNKVNALKVLYSRLYEQQEEERQKELEKIGGEKKDIAWGSQIRSYVFQPYTQVKDHRTGFLVGNGKAVMDGELDGFLMAELMGSRHTYT
jgi:peptide chain release factor 2